MKNSVVFGTFNVPLLSESLTASYTAPGLLPDEEQAKINNASVEEKQLSNFNQSLKKGLEWNPKEEK
ncbi:hypothetical protein D2V93_15935 [Flagellimonas taeanensis]|uniref:hypothetical protein n=1 Tax=Flavobacteriaceae TaxID=49546 RepID=UPI000E6945E2|nr:MULTISPECIES: hypothetical protein [Allomuricauda]MDC6383882.1 hypothetical protein [Muricauda sp. SK9]RIV48500.1 hypothetical protein D2V93_15935 [Allomuricauda taeanensis]